MISLKLRQGFFLLPLLMAGLIACSSETNLNNPPPGGGTPTPTPTIVPPGDDGTEVIGEPGLCTSGDVARVDFDQAGTARFALKSSTVDCAALKDNRVEEYTLILYNTTGSPMSFRIDSPINESPPTATTTALRAAHHDPINDPVKPPVSTARKHDIGVTSVNHQAENLALSYRLNKKQRIYGNRGGLRAFSASMAVGDEAEFRVRCDRDDDDEFCTTSAILKAQGTHINIFVDRDALSGNIDSLDAGLLAPVVAAYETNPGIYQLSQSILADTSDVDDDGRVSVLVTPILNRELTGDSKNFSVQSYTDPRDLLPYDAVSNPGSNEGEIIYVWAPDSLGNYNTGGNGLDAATFATKDLMAWVAFQLTHLISFNQHVFVSGGGAEDDWIDDGMGTVFADLCGFNIFRGAAQLYLANPQVDDLREAEDLDLKDFEGNEYLFMLYYLQSQVDAVSEDTNGDGVDDDLELFHTLLTSGAVGTSGLEEAVNYTFDEDTGTEFQEIFKDWTIAIVTSGSGRTDLQQSGVTALKYFLTLNPSSRYGANICNGSGSTRTGATGFSVGFDMNLYSTDDLRLIENADEHVYAPGNGFFGYVDPYSAMYVRVSGLFATKQNLSIKGSPAASIRGFIVRRSDLDYLTGPGLYFPKVYSESLTGSLDQHAEDLDLPGPNPYWPTRLDISSLVGSSAIGGVSKEWITIVGRIDSPNDLYVCDSTGTIEGCSFTPVADTDKYMFTVPDLPGRTDEGELAISVRRQFDDGSDVSSLAPVLAVVSSKDVPYPYAPHPIRSAAVGGNTTRQQYRWLTEKLICGDTEGNFTTNTPDFCTPAQAEDSLRVVLSDEGSGIVENTGFIPMVSGGPWDGNINGGECDDTPDNMTFGLPPLGVNTAGYGGEASTAVTNQELSPSSLGMYGHSFVPESFMTISYSGQPWPDTLFAREFLKGSTGYPSDDPDSIYDPRSSNGASLNCHLITGGEELDEAADSPDDFLEPGEMSQAGTLAEQILIEMSRGRETEGLLPAQYQDNDVFAIDGDSRDDDVECHTVDAGNNVNTFTTRTGEGGLIWDNQSWLAPHIRNNLSNSAISTLVDPTQGIYQNGGEFYVRLTPGKSYTIIVGGTTTAVGNYEVRIRKVDQSRTRPRKYVTPGPSEFCYLLF